MSSTPDVELSRHLRPRPSRPWYGMVILMLVIGSCTALPLALAGTETQSVAQRAQLLFDAQNLFGVYDFGDGMGVNCTLELRKDHTFTFRWTGCLGEYDRNNGKWSLEGDVVVAKPERPNKREGFRGMSVRFIPVQWGDRIYLPDENETPGFVASLHTHIIEAKKSGGKTTDFFEERLLTGDTYCKRKADSSALPKVEPLIPQRYRDYYTLGEVRARVVRLLSEGKIVLNKGSLDRVHPGLLMSVNAFENIDLQVIRVGEHEAVAKPLYVWNSRRKATIGDKFTTGNRWSRPHGTGYQWLPAPPDERNTKPAKK